MQSFTGLRHIKCQHPLLVSDRILRYAAIIGRENVIADTDYGLGGRVHTDLAWAKLRTLVEGHTPGVDITLALVEHARGRDPIPVQTVACAAGDAAYNLPSRSWIRPARIWRCTAMPTWFGRSLGHAR